jgi:Spy/CpxP family protein refolding chaperone
MKKIISVLAVLVAISMGAAAQESDAMVGEKKKHHGRKAMHKKMRQELQLSKEQDQQMREINKSMKGQLQGIRNDQSLSNEQKREKLKALHKERRTKVNGILTPGQQEQMKKFRKAHHQKMKERKQSQRGRQGRVPQNQL